jgi:shikimate dehydrogenase
MKKYGLLGRNLAHSFSKTFFEAKFKKESLANYSYQNIELQEIADFKTLLLKESFNGLNVTIPYKESVIPFLDSLTKEAEKIISELSSLNQSDPDCFLQN